MTIKVLATQQIHLTEIFTSIQGETSFSGLPTTFIRLSACNLRCSWCDTPYSFGRGTPKSFPEIYTSIETSGTRNICITGGEPLLQESIYPLMKTLCDDGYNVTLETGGSLPIDKVDPRVITILDIKCPGSGMSDKNHFENLRKIREHDEVKFVILNRHDYDYAKNICEKYHLYDRARPPLFSPVHGKVNPQALVNWILEDQLPIRLNLQIHKYIWSPETKGV